MFSSIFSNGYRFFLNNIIIEQVLDSQIIFNNFHDIHVSGMPYMSMRWLEVIKYCLLSI